MARSKRLGLQTIRSVTSDRCLASPPAGVCFLTASKHRSYKRPPAKRAETGAAFGPLGGGRAVLRAPDRPPAWGSAPAPGQPSAKGQGLGPIQAGSFSSRIVER